LRRNGKRWIDPRRPPDRHEVGVMCAPPPTPPHFMGRGVSFYALEAKRPQQPPTPAADSG
jgi:hypothetical protein